MNRIALAVCVLLLGLSGCASLVSTQLDKRTNFSQYKTFGWLPAEVKVKNPVYDSKLIDRNIKYAVEQELAKRGISKDNGQPDLLVKYHTYTEKKQQNYSSYSPNYPFYGYRWGMFPYRWGWGMPYYGGWGSGYNRNYTYTAGTLVLDVIDNHTDELIWRGSIEGDVDNINRLQKQVDKAVQAIMKKYPVQPGQSPDDMYQQKPLAS